MKNKFAKVIILVLAIFTNINLKAIAGSDIDPATGASVGGGILTLCEPTEDKACIYLEPTTITARIKSFGQINEYLYNLETCGEDWRGTNKCTSNFLTLKSKNLVVIDRNRNEYLFGNDQVFVNLLARDEKVVSNGQLVPQTFHLNIGQGRVGTTETRFSLSFEDASMGITSDTSRKSGIEYFSTVNTPSRKYTTTPVPRRNLLHTMTATIDSRNQPNVQTYTFDIGTLVLRVGHENPLNINLANLNNGKGPNVGNNPPNPNPNPNLATFEMDADGDLFRFRSSVPATIAQIRAILAGTNAININNARIEGEIVAGTQPYNPNWAFHLKENTIEVFTGTDFRCDGSAKVISRNLANIGSPNFFFDRTWCPNTSKLIREIF